MAKKYHVYIMSNAHHTVLYTGMTSDIIKRGWQYKQQLIDGFSKRYNCTKMVYIEEYNHPQDAIDREKQIKAGSRKKKLELIEELNPN
ncbi:GIY-YIG nuclease family protein [Fodinibius halophilus]|uniref:GIY-YIG nuclease family protein n=1 Tax=Fodinibius halophilus TaxID=1736908 RepID=A0A6M1TEJ0_9BACT|nr:GIY-YIG nuclease family protein [Fodinibius halophilus]NGP89194.1 GIY-YIG nuclease family protein [Fodinibius halophilus]